MTADGVPVTLIAGIRCTDGFLLAADTAVSTPSGTAVFHGSKLHSYRSATGKSYSLAICYAGNLTYARMAAQTIRDSVDDIPSPTIPLIKDTIVKGLIEIYTAHISAFWKLSDSEAPHFSLIIGIEVGGHFELMTTEDTVIAEISTYAFQGIGYEMAQYLGEMFLRSRGNAHLTFPISTAVHLITEIFRVVKQYVPGVGLDTQIIGWRALDGVPFSTPATQLPGSQSLVGGIQDNLKSAIWMSYSRVDNGQMLEAYLSNVTSILRHLQAETAERHQSDVRFVRYALMPSTGDWSMEALPY